MNIATEIFSVYQDLYNESTDEFWASHAERLGYSIEILRELFEPKEGEYDALIEFVDEFLADKILLKQLLQTYEERNIQIMDVDAIRDTFISIIDHMEANEIQEIIDEQDPYGFSIGLCESVLIVLEESLMEMFQEGI